MLKNNKGYLLAETIIAITVVATVITTFYLVAMNNYIKQNNNLTKFNTNDGVYKVKEVKKYFYEKQKSFVESVKTSDYIDITSQDSNFFASLDVKKAYFSKTNLTNYLTNESINYLIKNDLKNNKNNNGCGYMYILIFNDNVSYSSIGAVCNE